MKPSLLRELTLYRYRYIIGYGLFIIFLFGLLLTDISTVPYGLSDAEMQSSISSNSLNPITPQAADVINLPYHLLQKASIGLFGLTPLSIKLPSLLLGFLSGAALAITLHQWFQRGTAMLTLLIATASVPFIAMSRTGTADVLYMLLLLLILLSAVKLTTKAKGTFFWKMLVSAAGLLLFYMPLGIYAVIALLIAGILHPHVRYQIKRTRWWQFIVLFLEASILLAPLVIACVIDNNTFATLLGMESLRDKLQPAQLWASFIIVLKTLFYFGKPQIGEITVPFLDLPFMLFVMFGLIRSIQHRHSARSYLLLIWFAISIPLLLLNVTQFALLFVPFLILMAIGIETFMREWYKLFPRNPYARLAGLMPLLLIVIGLLTISTSRYFYGFYYGDTAQTYHPEIMAIQESITPLTKTQLVVPEEDVAFYDILRSKHRNLSVVSPGNTSTDSKKYIVLASVDNGKYGTPDKIITSYFKDNSVLLRSYTEKQ